MKRIFLIGYMGAGKTTLGKALARETNLDFYDLDWFIEDRFHKKISDIFAERGESGFREIERNMLREVGEFENVIISCGGGTPCFFDNMDYMNGQGDTIFLNATPVALKEHLLMGKSQRPLIQGKSPEELVEFIKESLAGRMPFYTKAKHSIIINTIHTREDIQSYVAVIQKLITDVNET